VQLALALLCLFIGIVSLGAAIRDPRVDARFAVRSLVAMVLFLLYGGAGLAILFLFASQGAGDAGGAVVFAISWYGAGLLLLIDRAPRLNPYPLRAQRMVRLAIWLLIAVAIGSFVWMAV